MDLFQTIIVLFFLAAILVGIAQKVKVPYPTALLIGGIIIGFIPGIPPFYFDPNLILIIVLPPILYAAAFSVSFLEFKKNWREIFSLALGLVVITTVVIGTLFKWLFPQFSWALAFAFGAIISPPDSVAATAILKRFTINPRLLAILEGESLINDASALVLYKLAIVALLSGTFSFNDASLQFVKTVIGGLFVGIFYGILLQDFARRFLEAIPAIVFSFTIPYITYITAQFLDVSGVLAVVVNGLIGSRILAKHHSSLRRVLGFAFWDIFIIIMNCFVFILIGLQLRRFSTTMSTTAMMDYFINALIITLALIAIRFTWVYSRIAFSYFKAFKNPKLQHLCPKILREATIISWSGMRGIVSLTAALALPYAASNGEPIEGRDEVIFISFLVILITLLLPSTTLPYLLSMLKLDHYINHQDAHRARKLLAKKASDIIDSMREREEINAREFTFLSNYFALQRYVFELSDSHLKKMSNLELARLNILKEQRRELLTMWEAQEIDDRLFRQIEHELDVEESHIARAELK